MASLNDFNASKEWISPSPQLWRMRRVQGGIVAAIAMAAAGVVVGIYTSWWLGLAAAAVVFCIALFALRALRRRVHSWQYMERDDDLNKSFDGGKSGVRLHFSKAGSSQTRPLRFWDNC